MNETGFSIQRFLEPDSLYWPGYFWLWNGPVDRDSLLNQLRDMYRHGARSVCVHPMPPGFRPLTMNNQLSVPYLGEEFFARVKEVAAEAEKLGMNYWLYDEGGWPSGEACGLVTAEHPELRASVWATTDDGTWEIRRMPEVDRLNPQATERFIRLTHQAYREAVGGHFSRTIRFAFTDEPCFSQVVPGRRIPWNEELGREFEQRFGYRFQDHLDVFARPAESLTVAERNIRVDFFDTVSQRFVDAYLLPLRQWCRENGLRSGGHLGGEDDTAGGVRHGYGHILRTLRAMDLPGVDAIWRQIFPGKANHHFPLFAASAAHQIGSSEVFTESFAVYGSGITLEQMKWVTDFQYVRGCNLLVESNYPFSTRDHLMVSCRPNFGALNPLWDHIPVFHAYVARLGYTLTRGEPNIENAVYLPTRDFWACDGSAVGYEAIVELLLHHQCGFDLIDDDILTDPDTRFENGACCVGSMRYRRIIMPPCQWLSRAGALKLAEFAKNGGKVICLNQFPGVAEDDGETFRRGLDELSRQEIYVADSPDALVRQVPSLIHLAPADDPASRNVRVLSRKLDEGAIYFVFNEGDSDFAGSLRFRECLPVNELIPQTGERRRLTEAVVQQDGAVLPLFLPAGQSRVFLCGDLDSEPCPVRKTVGVIEVAGDWQARMVRRFDVGEHDYEITSVTSGWEPVEPGSWTPRFPADFSGDIAYRTVIEIPTQWRGYTMRLDLGRIEYAARILVNGQEVSQMAWSPWEVDLPQVEESSFELEIIVTNTLANLITSQRVRSEWEKRQGPGWLGPYDPRTKEFEKDTRGGGLYGPVRLTFAP